LLEQAHQLDPDLPRLVALRAVHAYSPEISAAVRQGRERVLVAVPTGESLEAKNRDEGSWSFFGDELLLTSAVITAQPETGEESSVSTLQNTSVEGDFAE